MKSNVQNAKTSFIAGRSNAVSSLERNWCLHVNACYSKGKSAKIITEGQDNLKAWVNEVNQCREGPWIHTDTLSGGGTLLELAGLQTETRGRFGQRVTASKRSFQAKHLFMPELGLYIGKLGVSTSDLMKQLCFTPVLNHINITV